jgi:spermidine/putrescine-binding protein
VLTAGLGFFISKKQDEASKKLATRLAVTEAFYKRKLAVYEDADKQMVAVVGCLEDLRLSPSDAQLTTAFDNVRKLTDTAKTNGLYLTQDVADGLVDVAFTASNSPPLNGTQGNNLKTVTEKVGKVESQMKKELEGFGSLE